MPSLWASFCYTQRPGLSNHTHQKNSIILISLDDDYEIDKKIIKGYCLPGKKGNCWNAYKIEIHVLFPLKNIAFMTQSEPHWNICMYLSTQKISLFKIINSQTEAWNVVGFFKLLQCSNKFSAVSLHHFKVSTTNQFSLKTLKKHICI